MWSLIENNPTMSLIVGIVVVVTVLLHVGVFMAIRFLQKQDRPADD